MYIVSIWDIYLYVYTNIDTHIYIYIICCVHGLRFRV